MDATLIVIDDDAELARARELVERLMASEDPAALARLAAQARLIAAYEEAKWPRRRPSLPELMRYLMDQHRLTRADMVPLLGSEQHVDEVLRGKRQLSLAMIRRLQARFSIPGDLLLPAAAPPRSRSRKRPAA